jgi:tRNA (adenine57-N1/adenine58-N1)-methyltransferase
MNYRAMPIRIIAKELNVTDRTAYRYLKAIKESGNFTEPESSETIVRGWHHEGLAVRPQHRMIGHTGFLIFARRMAPGVAVLPRRRRPSKGSYGVVE